MFDDDLFLDNLAYEQWEDHVANLRRESLIWAGNAACADHNMYPPRNDDQLQLAQEVCASCPVLKECLYVALVGKEEHGVWGGTTEQERANIIDQLENTVGDYRKKWGEEARFYLADTTVQLVAIIRITNAQDIQPISTTA